LLTENRGPDNPVILLGIKKDGRMVLNPRKKDTAGGTKTQNIFRKGDALIVMAFDPPNLSSLRLVKKVC
jgi:hypothetical protein